MGNMGDFLRLAMICDYVIRLELGKYTKFINYGILNMYKWDIYNQIY